jgi:hypothetical protein
MFKSVSRAANRWQRMCRGGSLSAPGTRCHGLGGRAGELAAFFPRHQCGQSGRQTLSWPNLHSGLSLLLQGVRPRVSLQRLVLLGYALLIAVDSDQKPDPGEPERDVPTRTGPRVPLSSKEVMHV